MLPLLQTIPKAESPLSFWETKRPPGPIRVILGTAGLDIGLDQDMVAPAQAG